MSFWAPVLFAVFLGGPFPQQQPPAVPPADADLRIWSEFVSLQKSGRIGEEHLRPAYSPKATVLEFLAIMRRAADWREWDRQPEVHRVGPRVHFVIPLSENGVRNTYSFTFLVEGGHWFLEHFESIVIRLDRLGPPPVSDFPDLPEEKKAWMRQEKYWSMMVQVFLRLKALSGTDAALTTFRDGPGYLVEARTWVPFFAPEKAFVVYLCWEQSRLQGNVVTLERLADREAVVTMDTVFRRLYTQSSHMRRWIPEAEYARIFETVWEDRARAAGWTVTFSYDGPRCTMRFTRTAAADQHR